MSSRLFGGGTAACAARTLPQKVSFPASASRRSSEVNRP